MIHLSRRTTAIGLGLLAVALTVYAFRWVIGGRAIEIVDPIVRAWAAEEVARLSEGAYRLQATPIRVTIAEQRVAIDSIIITTDSVRNAARPAPLPTITARYFNCAVEGIDLERLARRRGFSADRAGCDSVQLMVDVPANVARDSAGGSFLSLQDNLDLARGIPFVDVDSVVLPDVVMALTLRTPGGQATTARFDHMAVRLEALHYDPDDPPGERRTLLSRNVTLAVDSLVTHRESTDRMRLDRLRADLADGTVELAGLAWRPGGGELRDSLGLTDLSVDRLEVAGIDWREFLTRGNVVVHRIALAGTRLTLLTETSPGTTGADLPTPPWTLASSLDAIDRGIRLDSLLVEDLMMRHVTGRDTATTRVEMLALTSLDAAAGSAFEGTEPIGPMTVALRGVERVTNDRVLRVATAGLDLGRGTASVDSLSYAPIGTDADFVRRHRRRTDRIDLRVVRLRLSGLEPGAWVRRGAYRAGTATIAGLDLDVLSDKRLPSGPAARRRTPQQWMQQVAPPVAIDSTEVRGRLQYRERARESPRPGVLRFEQVTARIVNLRNILVPEDTRPTTATIESRLMGAAPLTLTLELPLLDTTFAGRYRGQLGSLPAAALNPFIDGALGARFTDGRVHSIAFEAEITNGMARGRVVPRYEGLWIELPGVARTGFLSGLRRAVAKFAANQFVVREDNVAGGSDVPRNGPILHRWRRNETLLQFIWNGVRDGLLQVVKR
ncbi:MAG TPA: hypothetical protein VFN22_03175 [Gemmatimonadales bacterium]|nr:hypothetical protein [Gemmatimonadales bacterium]